ncbi:Rpn family recombination-promoting nuclease/putative transposase [Myxococcota bacterium]|nr:Rpn family recombination-promoting nuclease/putative transposase [Myxococcota bacterium]
MSLMRINPLVDFAFKKVLGDPGSTDILLDFINSFLHLDIPIAQVEILNPFNPQDDANDKFTVVDVKARDEHGRLYQIEVQLQNHAALPERALFSWARTYAHQLGKGIDYQELRPTLSIWILDALLFPESPKVHHRFRLMDREAGMHLTDHVEIHLIQLPRFQPSAPLDEEGRWVYFLKEARNWTTLPPSLDSPALRRAMDKLDDIRQSTADRLRYQAREDYLHLQATLERSRREAMEDLAQAKEQLAQVQEKEAKAKEQAAQAQEQAAKAQEQAAQAQEQAAQAKEQTAQAKEQAAQAKEQTAQAKEQTAQAKEQTAQAKEQTAQAQEQAAKAKEQAAKAKEQAAKAQEQAAKAQEQAAQANEQAAQAQEQAAKAQEQAAKAQEQAAKAQEQAAENAARLEQEQADNERLRVRLRAAGWDPDA